MDISLAAQILKDKRFNTIIDNILDLQQATKELDVLKEFINQKKLEVPKDSGKYQMALDKVYADMAAWVMKNHLKENNVSPETNLAQQKYKKA
jgi:hypothetical protein